MTDGARARGFQGLPGGPVRTGDWATHAGLAAPAELSLRVMQR